MRIYVLFEKGTNKVVMPGTILTTFNGEKCVLESGKPPQHDASTGRIYVKDVEHGFTAEYFPSVCGLEWRKV